MLLLPTSSSMRFGRYFSTHSWPLFCPVGLGAGGGTHRLPAMHTSTLSWLQNLVLSKPREGWEGEGGYLIGVMRRRLHARW